MMEHPWILPRNTMEDDVAVVGIACDLTDQTSIQFNRIELILFQIFGRTVSARQNRPWQVYPTSFDAVHMVDYFLLPAKAICSVILILWNHWKGCF